MIGKRFLVDFEYDIIVVFFAFEVFKVFDEVFGMFFIGIRRRDFFFFFGIYRISGFRSIYGLDLIYNI